MSAATAPRFADPIEELLPAALRPAGRALADRWRREGLHRGQTLADVLAEGARVRGGTPLVFHSTVRPARVTLAEVHDRAQRVAGALHELGLREGDRLAVQLPNWAETAIAYYAAAALGLVLVPVVPTVGPADVGFIVRQSGARALVLPALHRRRDAARDVPRLGDVPELAHVVTVGDGAVPGYLDWATLERTGPAAPAPAGSASAGAAIVYTSGTTADPKGVLHTHDSLLAELHASPTPPPRTPGTVTLQPFPAGHTAGLVALLAPAIHGYPTVLLDAWDPDACVRLIAEHRVTSMAGTPYMIGAVLDAIEAGTHDTSSLTHGITGGGGIPPALIERADAVGWRIGRCYGATECPSATAGEPDDPLASRARTDGRPLGGNRIRIVDPDGRDLPAGESGEIVLAGPELFAGYTDPALNDDAFLPDGWFRTGDIGRLDADGFLTVTDRIKDVIIRGGENISSQEVESVLARHPAIAEAAVVAVPDARYGERVCACVVLRAGHELDIEDLVCHFDALGIARHKVPERLETLPALPRTASGKVRKHDLRARLG